jgi:hypothetical protein
LQCLVLHGVRWPAHIKNVQQLDAMKALPCRPSDVFVPNFNTIRKFDCHD